MVGWKSRGFIIKCNFVWLWIMSIASEKMCYLYLIHLFCAYVKERCAIYNFYIFYVCVNEKLGNLCIPDTSSMWVCERKDKWNLTDTSIMYVSKKNICDLFLTHLFCV